MPSNQPQSLEPLKLDELPLEMLAHIFTFLKFNDLKNLSKVSKIFYEMMSELYFNSLHGRSLRFIPWLESEISKLIKEVENIRKENQVSLFNLPQHQTLSQKFLYYLQFSFFIVPTLVLFPYISWEYRNHQMVQENFNSFDQSAALERSILERNQAFLDQYQNRMEDLNIFDQIQQGMERFNAPLREAISHHAHLENKWDESFKSFLLIAGLSLLFSGFFMSLCACVMTANNHIENLNYQLSFLNSDHRKKIQDFVEHYIHLFSQDQINRLKSLPVGTTVGQSMRQLKATADNVEYFSQLLKDYLEKKTPYSGRQNLNENDRKQLQNIDPALPSFATSVFAIWSQVKPKDALVFVEKEENRRGLN